MDTPRRTPALQRVSWQLVRVKAPKAFELTSDDLVVAGPGDIWLLGREGKQGWLLHLHGGRWSRTRAPLRVGLAGATSDGHGGLWAPGSSGSASYVYHLSNSGRWTVQTIGINGTAIWSIAPVPGRSAFLGSGIEWKKARYEPAVWRIG